MRRSIIAATFLAGPLCPLTTIDARASTTYLTTSTFGYYNDNLSTLLDGTQEHFPTVTDPNLPDLPEPDLSSVSSILGGWLNPNPLPLNGNWSSTPQDIPFNSADSPAWPIEHENAIVFEINAGSIGISNLVANFGSDNGIFMWLNGEYQFGAVQAGNFSDNYTVNFGDLCPGTHYLQILREDHGDSNGWALQVTGDALSGSVWNVNSNGNWGTSGNWSGGVPDATDAVAIFGSVITQPRTVTVDGARSAGAVYFSNANAYTIGGSGTLTLSVSSGVARMTVCSGSHTIAAPLALADETVIKISNSAAVLTLSDLRPVSVPMTKLGPGRLDVAQLSSTEQLAVRGGTLRFTEIGPKTSKVAELAVSNQGTLDIGRTRFVIDYDASPSPLATVRDYVAAGRITSFSVDSSVGIGWGQNSASSSDPLHYTTFGLDIGGGSMTVDASSILLRTTYFGDATLDGTVNITDYAFVAANFGDPPPSTPGFWTWADGNFDGDNDVDSDDYDLMASNWNQTLPSGDYGSRAGRIPEPTAGASLVVVAGFVLRRHRAIDHRH